MTANDLKWIESVGLVCPRSKEGPEFINVIVPAGAEFIGIQHEGFSTVLVMLVHGKKDEQKDREGRTVVRVVDGTKLVGDESRYIGSDGKWHVFEVLRNKETK